MAELYLEVSSVSGVLARRALQAVRGIDGRQVDPVVVGKLEEIAGIADALCLPDSDGFATLAGAAASGDVRDLHHCALRVL